MTAAGRRDADLRTLAPSPQHFGESLIEPFVVQIGCSEFLIDPITVHLITFLPDLPVLWNVTEQKKYTK